MVVAWLGLLGATAVAAETRTLAPGTLVLMESGWAQIDIREYAFPDPVSGHEGRCAVAVYRDFETGGYVTGPRACADEALLAGALEAASRWRFDILAIYYVGQTGGLTLDFDFAPDEVRVIVDESWFVSPPEKRPAGIETTNVEVLRRAYPKYPRSLRGSGQEASCSVLVAIAPSGRPMKVDVQGCDDPFATEAARAARRWRWQPPIRNGEAVPAKSALKFHFQAE